MATPRKALTRQGQLSDEVELYHRTYTTLLRSSGETLLRVLESAHRTMGVEPAPAGRRRRAGPRRLHLRLPAPAGHDLAGARRGDGAGPRAGRGLDAARGARPAPPLVRHGRRPPRRAAGLDVGPRRRHPDARRLPDRVEQDPRPRARGRRAARRRRRSGRGAGRDGGGLGAPAAGLGRRPRGRPGQRRRAPAEPAHPPARRLGDRLRADDAALVAAGAGRARRATGRCTWSRRTCTRSSTSSRAGRASTTDEIRDWVVRAGPPELRAELEAFDAGHAEGAWENFLYYAARGYFDSDESMHDRRAGVRARRRRPPPLEPHGAARSPRR